MNGYSTSQVVEMTGATMKQLNYWATTGVVDASLRPAAGSGSRRLWSDADVRRIRVALALMAQGFTMRAAFARADTTVVAQ